jgi:hypothetical protein
VSPSSPQIIVDQDGCELPNVNGTSQHDNGEVLRLDPSAGFDRFTGTWTDKNTGQVSPLTLQRR